MTVTIDYPLTWAVVLVCAPALVWFVARRRRRIARAPWIARGLTAVGIAMAMVDHLLFGSQARSTCAPEGVDPWSLETLEERLLWLVTDVDDPRFQRGA